uniref:TRAPPC10/Trs130 N-terminal domain-containing protein n=1 Tax=Bionectria ochroleuca TaxID=29856 RepID=A0A8H7KDH9_BIOOC
MKDLILSSFDKRVTKYEEGIRERDSQRNLPGWNFCTFFILKEGLARGFETVGLVEDALVGYDELSVGLDSIIKTQIETGAPEQHGGALLKYSEEVKSVIDKALKEISDSDDDEEAVDMQSGAHDADQLDEIAISATKKPYRDMILANDVSVFDFQCYIFARQIALLLRLGNTFPSREELIAKLKEQQDSVLHGVAPRAPPPASKHEETENFTHLAEVCRRTLQFIPAVSQVMRDDIYAAVMADRDDSEKISSQELEVIDNVVSSFAFSVAEQVLAQTSSSSLPVPPSTLTPSGSTLAPSGATEPKASIPEPKTMLHPARSSSLLFSPVPQPPPSPGVFPNPGAGAPLHWANFRKHRLLRRGWKIWLLSAPTYTSCHAVSSRILVPSVAGPTGGLRPPRERAGLC